MGRTDGTIQKAVYQYNGLGHRMGQSIATGDAAPAQTIRYTLDLTRQYHNLLQKTGNGTLHCSNDADKFMEPLFQEYLERGIKTYLRGDSGFSSPKLYKTCEMNGCSYAIRLKQNSSLMANFCIRLVPRIIQGAWFSRLKNHTVS